MVLIKNIGRYCLTDQSGYISNDSAFHKIDLEYLEILQEVIKNYLQHLGNDIHSIYIRGSIPRGLAIKGVSDLDTIAVTYRNPKELDLSWVKQAEHEMNRSFSCVTGIELSFYHVEDILEISNFSIIAFMLKTHSVCVYGKDLIQMLPKYKADKALANEHLFHLKSQIERAKADLINNEDAEDIKDCCSWIMKIIIRAGLALVIIDENLYTRDLYPAYQLFSKHFPQEEPRMRKALEYAIEPTTKPDLILDFINDFGSWITDKAEKWLQTYNPQREPKIKL
ncbi:hypothetical protein ACFDTO_35725 [Microbacteriaceae bacterium 4G12]